MKTLKVSRFPLKDYSVFDLPDLPSFQKSFSIIIEDSAAFYAIDMNLGCVFRVKKTSFKPKVRRAQHVFLDREKTNVLSLREGAL